MTEVDAWVAEHRAELLEFYRERHRHPELSLHEERSAAAVAERLAAAGYEVTTGVGGTGVVGVLRNGGGPTVLIRGDMDALPVTEETGLPYRSRETVTSDDGVTLGVMHACGHDLHMTHLVGVATVLADLKSRWQGTVVAVAQPAEELGLGAAAMLSDPAFERLPRPDACLALHVMPDIPAGEVGITSGWATANVDSVDITIFGRGGHGSRPHETVDPVVTAAEVVLALQTLVSRQVDPMEAAVVTVGSLHAGSKHNIIPDEARLQLTVRSFSDEVRQVLRDGIRRITVGTCRAMGCPKDPDVSFRDEEFTPSGYNDPQLAERATRVMSAVLGADRVHATRPLTVGEDFALFARTLEAPGLMYWLGAMPPDLVAAAGRGEAELPALHSGTFAPDAGPTLATGIRCTAALALELLGKARR